MGKTAIYTCIIGSYDNLLQPPLPSGDCSGQFDFICFVGRGEKSAERIGLWEIREIDKENIVSKKSNAQGSKRSSTLIARYCKTHPHILLPEYQTSLWIDGNIQIKDNSLYEILCSKRASDICYSGVPHPTRDCVYKEARKCRDMRYLSDFKLLRVWAWLFFNGTKRHSGLIETNLTYRRHNEPQIVRFDELWWKYISTLCHRDQLSIMYCLRKCGIKPDFLLPNGQNSRNFKGLKYLRHK